MSWHSFAQALVLGLIFSVPHFAAAESDGLTDSCPDYVVNHAPLVWLHSDDPYRPSDLLTHIQHTTPTVNKKPISGLPPLDLDNLEILNESEGEVALVSSEDPLTFPEWLLGVAPDATGQIHNATPCVVIIVEKNQVEVDAFYFYFYSWNEGPNVTQVLEPLDRLLQGSEAGEGMSFGLHVGDWEHNMVRFHNGDPVGIYYSQHVDGAAYKWNDPVLSKVDERPIVYSARGSHANYPASGLQLHDAALVDYCDEGQRWDPVLSAYFYRFHPENFTVTRLAPPNETISPSSNLTSCFYFDGIWGDHQWPDSDPRQKTAPYFGLKRFRDGPTGPRHKHLVRKGLRPDKRRVKSWMEWIVTVFMAIYPYYLKGWRKWVSLVVLICLSVGFVIAIKYGIRRFGRRAYRKLKTEEIALDDWTREAEFLLTSSEESDHEEEHR